MEQVRIAILDAYDNVCAFLDNGAPKGLHYYEDELHEYLKGAANTFSFKSSAKHEDSAYLTEGNKLAFQYHDRDYYLNIMRVVRDEWTVEVIAYSLSFELLNEQKEAYKAPKAMSFAEYLNVMDYEKVLTLKINEVSDKKITHEWTGTDTLLKRVYSLATVFGAEVEFIPELNRDHSLKRILLNVYEEHSDTAQGIGQERTDLTLRYGINVTGITKTSDITELYTAIRPFGKDGLTVTNLDKTELDADGNIEFQSPKGNRNILAVQARDRFPSNPMGNLNDRYIAKIWSYDTDNVNVLYGQALAELKKNCVPQVEYEVSGYFDTGIGDTVTIVDEEYTPELYLSARVTEQIVSFTDRTRNQTIFSNFKELQSEIDPELLARMNTLIESNKVYSCIISTDNGIVFKNGEGSTTLTATVRDGGADKTEDFSIVWYKDGTELVTGVSVTINAADVSGKAVYRFEAKDSSGNVKGFCEATVVGVADGSDGDPGFSPKVEFNEEDNTLTITNKDGSETTPSLKGETGIGIRSVSVYYAVNNDEETHPTEWTTDIPATTAANRYLWSYEEYTFTDGNKHATEPKVIGRHATDGKDGEDGKDAAIISSTEPADKSMLWCDTSVSPPVIKQYDGTEWVIVNDQSETVKNIYSNISSMLNENESGILSQVEEKLYDRDKLLGDVEGLLGTDEEEGAPKDLSALIGQISTTLQQTSSSFEFQFNQLLTSLNDLSGDTDDRFEEVKKYIRLVDGNIIIGIEDNPLTLKLQNDRISFMEGETEVAYISNQKLYITDAEVTNSLALGNFAFIPRANGNLSFKKVR